MMDTEIMSDNSWEPKDASYVADWFMVGSPVQCFLILAVYLSFVLKIGPFLMKDREPFKLTNIILFYNVIQVILSGYILKLAVVILLNTGLVSKRCISGSEELQYAYFYGVYVYYLAKLSELLDTVFFVLRKKYNQVSFLHVYHHTTIFFYSWLALRSQLTVTAAIVLGCINSFIHLIMYSYYTLSVYPSLTKYLWWKRYITTLQMVQFIIIMAYAVFEYVTSPCNFTRWLLLHFVFHLSLVFYLFYDFYKKSYKTPQTKKKQS